MEHQHKQKGAKKKLLLTVLILLLAAAAVSGLLLYPKIHSKMIDREVWYPKAPRILNDSRHVVCIGDSITYGSGVILTRETEAWPALLEAELGENWQVLNYGLNGRTLLHDGDAPYIREGFWQKALNAEAEICIIMLGTNDSKPQNWDGHAGVYREDYLALITTYREKHPDTEIWLMQPPKCFPERSTGRIVYNISDDNIREEICGIVAEVAEETRCGLINLYTLTEDHPEWFADGVHPNAEGNRHIAEEVFRNIV